MSSKKTGKGLGILAHALLGMLAGSPMSGYDLTRAFDESLQFVWSAKHAQIYPELAWLLAGGYIEQTQAGARGRRVYAITPAGRTELQRWLIETRPDRSPRQETLLRSFFLWTIPPHDARAYYESIAAGARASLAQFEEIANAFEAKTPQEIASRIALESGLRHMRVTAEWAQWAAEQYIEDSNPAKR
ncbi:MAG: PadR family transcriptional regulator [Vulcanimicrobiaceae bacterium]